MNRKRVISWILIFAMVIGFAPVNIYASDVPQKQEVAAENDFDFEASSGTIKKYKGNAEEVVVPKEINGVAVKHIGTGAIAGKKNLTKIVLPEGIETIADQAFMANSELKEINFPDSLKTIGHSIFMIDKALEGELTLGSNLELLDRFTFGDGSRLGSQNVKLNIAPGKTKLTILRGTFGSEQTNVDIPLERPLLIKVNAFRTEEPVTLDFGTIDVQKGIPKEELLKTLQEKVPLNLYLTENDYKSMTEVGKGYELPIDWKVDAVDTNSTDEVTIKNSFTYNDDKLREALSIGPEIKFSSGNLDEFLQNIKVVGKLNFKEVVAPEEPSEDDSKFVASDFTYDGATITGFSKNGLKKFETLKEVNLPEKSTDGETITAIGKSAFRGKGIEKVTIPETVTLIDDVAFNNNNLKEIKLPSKLEKAGMSAFGLNKIAEVTIPGTLKEIPNGMFSTNISTKIVIEDGVETIGTSAFTGCKIDRLELPASVKSVGRMAFSGGSTPQSGKLKELILHEGLEVIGKGAFQKNNLTEVKMPSSLKEIGNNAFFGNGQVVQLKTTNKAHLDFNNKKSLKNQEFVLTEEEPTVDEWTQEDFTYGKFDYKNRMEEETFKFGITGFSDKGKAKIANNPDLVIPKEVTIDGEVKQIEGIGKHAFKGIKMNSVTFSEVDKGIGYVIKDSAFEDTGLTKVTLPEGLISIETRVFMNDNLTEIYIPSTVWKIGSEAFFGNKISTLDISDDVNMIQIDNHSFERNKLSLVKLPYSIFKFRDYVFKDNPGYENSGVVRLETRNPEHLKSTTYIVPSNDYHKVVLVTTDVNRSELFKELQAVKSIVREDYKKDDLAEFDKVLEEAKAIFKDQKSTQEQIDKAFDDLVKAETKLRKSAPDRSKLRDSIKKAEELIPEMFEKESYNAMKAELDKAKKVLANVDSTADEVKAAQENLDKAMDNLVINKNALYTSEDFTYKGNAITGFSESGKAKFKVNKDLVLPDTNPDGEDIEVIGKGAFSLEKDPGVKFGTDTVSSANGMKSLKLPKHLKRIEESAFRLNNFKNVDFPETLEYIGIAAFNGNRLEKVILPDSVTVVEGGAFSLNQITELRLSPNMKKVADGTFSRNIKLKELVIPEGIEVIGGSAFQGCPLTSLSISSTVKEIKQRAFTGQQLEELTIPGNVKKIGKQAFAHNIKWKRLKKLTLEEGIEEIGDSAFRFSLLLETNLPKSLKKLSDTAFRNAETTDKKPVVVKLYTKNPDHLKFNNEKSLVNQKVILKPGEIVPIPEIKAEDIEKEVVKQGEKIDVTDNIKNLPEKATVKDITEPKIDTNKPGEYTAKVEVTFENGAKRIVEVPVVVEKKEEVTPGEIVPIPEIKAEDIEKEVVKQGEKIDVTDNIKNLPEKATVKDITEPKIDTNKPGEYTAKVEVTFENGSKRIVEVPVVVEKKEEVTPVDPVEPTDPTDPTIPTDPTTPVEPTTPTENIKDTDTLKEIFEKIPSTRIAGRNRQLTAVEVSKTLFEKADTVIITSSDKMVDSLAASPKGIAINAPTLFVEKDSIMDEVIQEIKRLNPSKIIIAGGEESISDDVAKQLQQLGIKQQRIAGADRFETAVKLGEEIRRNSSNKTDVILVNGYNSIDALTAGSLAAKLNIPILLTGSDQLNKTTEKALKNWNIQNVIIVGGHTQVSETIASQLKNDGVNTSRLAGRTRVETALEVAKAVNSDPDKVIFANKDAFADALLAPYLSNAEKAPIVLIDKDEASVSVKQYLRDNEIKNGIILGGEKSIEEYK